MTTPTITLERFSEELSSLHGWSKDAVVEFMAATTHESLSREDWVRIACDWAVYETDLEVSSPTIFVSEWAVAVAHRGHLSVAKQGFSETRARQEAEALNKLERESERFDQGIRWYAVEISVIFAQEGEDA